MAIDAASADRATAADRREAARVAAMQYSMEQADMRRDTRVEEARAADAMRADRAAPSPKRLVDILA